MQIENISWENADVFIAGKIVKEVVPVIYERKENDDIPVIYFLINDKDRHPVTFEPLDWE